MENINSLSQLPLSEILERTVLENSPDLMIVALRIKNGMIKQPETAMIQVYKDSPLYPKPSYGMRFKYPESWAVVETEVVEFNPFTGMVKAPNNTWYNTVDKREPSKFEEAPIE